MTRIVLLSALLPALSAAANLNALRATMAEIRAQPADQNAPRGAMQKLTVAKHQLRDWIESNLSEFPTDGDEAALTVKLNSALKDAGLVCGETPGLPKCPDSTNSGFLEPLRIERKDFLTVITGVEIECGSDESVYVYSWSKEGWRRVWQNEQDDYKKENYKPQIIERVIVDGDNQANDYLALTLGSELWCASNWHNVYYRLFRLGANQDAAPLVEGSQWAFGYNPPIQGSLTRDQGAIVTYYTESDTGTLLREAVRNFKIDGSKITRIDPVALKPRDFVDEWLAEPWGEAWNWSEPQNRRSMLAWHEKLQKHPGAFLFPTMHCAAMPDLWQVGLDLSNPPTPIGQPPNGTYFLVRWRPPYTFRMVDVSKEPWQACTQPDRAADDAPAMLFFGWK